MGYARCCGILAMILIQVVITFGTWRLHAYRETKLFISLYACLRLVSWFYVKVCTTNHSNFEIWDNETTVAFSITFKNAEIMSRVWLIHIICHSILFSYFSIGFLNIWKKGYRCTANKKTYLENVPVLLFVVFRSTLSVRTTPPHTFATEIVT